MESTQEALIAVLTIVFLTWYVAFITLLISMQKKSAEQGRNPHILTLSPPLNMNPKWFKDHVAYTMAKVSIRYRSVNLESME